MLRSFVFVVLLISLICPCFADISPGLDKSAFDPRVRVQDDLYLAVNGSWLRDTPIPDDKSNYGSFSILADVSQERLKEIIESAAASTRPAGSDAQKVGDFYKSFMDEDRINQLGIQPLAPELAKIDAIDSRDALISYFGYASQIDVETPVGMLVAQDAKDSSRYLTSVVQSGITLPDRDFYLKDDEKFLTAREALKSYITRVLQLCKQEPGDVADQLLTLETRLAGVQWPRTELRDANKRYNKFAVTDLAAKMPILQWRRFFEAAGIASIEEVNVMTPSFFEGLEPILTETPIDVWKQYLRFKLVDAYATALSSEFDESHFELHGKVLAGILVQQPRWKRAVDATAGAGAGDFGVVGDLAGRLYVKQYFTAEARARMNELVDNLLKAYEQSIGELEWMTDVTKKEALEKLSRIGTKIGYTDKWREYTALEIEPDDLIGNLMRSAQVEHQRMIDKLGKPVDRAEWGMTPQTVNAYYNPSKNEIVFPAAILQPPFFGMDADDAVNYGGIGAVIGHEISHAFDDQGSKYDAEGNLNNWWNAKDRHEFTQLTQRLIDQYNGYEPLPGKTVNGELTLGENIADLSGLSIAHKAYEISLDGAEPPTADGWSGAQRFFLGWSQVWRRKYRDAEMIQRLLTDPHSPSWYRANGPVVNIDAFYKAFNVAEGDAMFRPPEERIKIW